MPVVPATTASASDPGDLESIIERALEEARARGASQAEAAVSQDTGLSVGVRLGEVETLEHQRDRSMGITVYFGQRKGSASTADFSAEAVRRDRGQGLQHRPVHGGGCLLGPGGCGADGAFPARSRPRAPVEHQRRSGDRDRQESARRRRSRSIRASTIRRAPRSRTHQGLHVYGNTHGFVGGYPTTSHTLSCVVLAGTGRGHAARLLVHDFAGLAGTAGCRRRSAAKARGARSRAWGRASSARGARRCCSCRRSRAA